jgi:eukaryotic-like serine/threonine-protein kinase
VLSLESLNGPYQIDIYASSAASAPTTLEAWTQIGDTAFSDQPGTVTREIDVPATFVLVWLKQLGPDEACTENNPYRGRLGEIAFAS